MKANKPDPNWKVICAKCMDGEIEPADCAYYGEPNGCNSPIYGEHPNAEDSSAVGNAAAMREALTKVSEWMAHRIATCGFEASPTFPTVLEDVVLPALAKPPRNCDNYNTEAEAKSAFLAYWNKNYETDYDIGDLKHNVNGITQDYAEWLMEGATDGK